MRSYEIPEMKISKFERASVVTASGEAPKKTAVELAQADAATLGASKTYTMLVK